MRFWFFLLLAIFSGVPVLLSQWNYLPAGYANVNAVVSDLNDDLIWVSTVDAGLWKTIDGGQNWIPANETVPLSPATIIHRLWALDSQCDTMFLQPGPFFYTTNGGNSWSTVSALDNNPAEALAVWRVDRYTWLACNHGVFARSVDFGETWITFPFEDGLVRDHIYQDRFTDSTLFVLSDYIFAQGLSAGGLIRSDNLGETWEELTDLHDLFGLEFAVFKDILRLSNGDLIALLPYTYPEQWSEGTILLSTDDGLTWGRVWGGLTSHFQPQQVIENLNVPGRLFLTGLHAFGMYWSQDYGRTWERCLNGLPENLSYCNDLKQNPFNGRISVCIGGIGIFASDNDGESWDSLPQPPIGSYGGMSYTGQTVFFRDGGGGQWQLPDTGNTWVMLNLPPIAEDTVMIISQMFTRRGDTLITGVWKYPFGPGFEDLSFQLIRSFDAGNSWNFGSFLSFVPGQYYAFEHPTLSAIWLLWSDDGLPRVSTDLGLTWQSREIPPGLTMRGIVQNESATYLLASNNDGTYSDIFRSIDFGETWHALNYPGPFLYGTRTLVPYGNDLFVKTEDGVDSHCLFWSDSVWEERGQVAEADFFIRTFAIELPEDTLLLGAATSNHIWFSTDLGYTWESRQFELPYPEQNVWLTNDVVYRDTDYTIWVMTGIGICYLELSALNTGQDPVHFLPADYTLLSAYPNPFNAQATILFDLDKPQRVALRLFNVEGQLVRTLADADQEAGRHQVALDAADLASGVYFVEIERLSGSKTQKLLLLK